MLVKQLRRAQDFIENALLHPHYQSREAGSCMGAKSSKSGRKLPVRSEAHVTPMLPLR